MQTKICKECAIEKPVSEYHPNKQCTYGVVSTCRICTGNRIKNWYKERRAERQEAANSRNKKRKRELVDHFGDKCLDCGKTYPQYVYQFHHLDPSQKDFNPSYGINNSPSKMWEEVKKCVMLCANCHIIRHRGKEDGYRATTD